MSERAAAIKSLLAYILFTRRRFAAAIRKAATPSNCSTISPEIIPHFTHIADVDGDDGDYVLVPGLCTLLHTMLISEYYHSSLRFYIKSD